MLRAIAVLPLALLTSAAERQTVWTGVFTEAQATNGHTIYNVACSRCHCDRFQGSSFIEHWREDNLSSLYNIIAKTMPLGEAGSLKESEYVDIVAYLLHLNGFPAGKVNLSKDQLSGIRFEGKAGPEPVPDFSLVQTAGCLTREQDGSWRLRFADEPVRTRDPNSSLSKEIPYSTQQVSGKLTFRLLDDAGLQEDAQNRRARVKGFLIRKAGDDRLNPTSVEVLGASCQPASATDSAQRSQGARK